MMVTLNAGASTGETPSPVATTTSARSMVSKGHPLHHRRRRPGPRGALAGFGYNKANSSNNSAESSSSAVPSPEAVMNGEGDMNPPGGPSGSSSAPGGKQQPQHNTTASSSTSGEATQPPAKPCHSARMAALCCQNAIRLGARAQLGLCPPGRSRRSLQAALRQRTRSSASLQSSSGGNNSNRRISASGTMMDTGGYYALEKMVGAQSLEDYEDQEEDYLLSTNTYDIDSDEEASSGDEDEITNMDALLTPDKPGANISSSDESKYSNLREPLFTPLGAEGSNQNGPHAMGSGASGRLPFNRRKLRYFDGITAVDRQAARDYLTREATKSRQRNAMLLSRHLRRMQLEEKRKARIEKGENPDNDNSISDIENEDAKEQALLTGGVSQFEQPMTAAMSAALILESLSLNPVESIEGISKCYDGIVAAGVALLDSQMSDPTSPINDVEKERPTRADILAALAPLLITSLDQPSGEVILLLAKLRSLCGTARYQRRFVQRVAPCLVRPRGAAMWCLKHQRDMEPILAAVELIFDSANDIFCKGWHEKGQLYLADSKRAETLNSAAMQLRNLSAEPAEGLSLGFTTHHGMRRNFHHGNAQKDTQHSSDQLAEWEVMAVDQEIRISISKIMSSDWNKVVLATKDSDSIRSARRSMAPVGKRPAVLPQSTSGEASPRAMLSSPRSPARLIVNKTPLSPPSTTASSPSDAFEKAFENTVSSLPAQSAERPRSPDSALVQKNSAVTLSPPPQPAGTNQDENDLKMSNVSGSTPPRSPKSPHSVRSEPMEQALPLSTVNSPFTPVSPARSKSPLPSRPGPPREPLDTSQSANVPFTPSLSSAAAPLSPSSVGTSTSANDMHFRPSSGSSVMSTGSGASQTAHYRTLTSTAPERKRTVAACRALRAQITRFEEAFIQMHGRPPKGAAERAPLATTYSQYREWKRAIRADAACRIQALFRGARMRWHVMRSHDARMRRIVLSRAGRVQFPSRIAGSDPPCGQGMTEDRLMNKIGIPVEIGAADSPSGTKHAASPGSPKGDSFAHPSNPSLAPKWNNPVLPRPGSDRPHDGLSNAPPTPPQTPPHGADRSLLDASTLPLAELQSKKRELKQQLKQYDMNFARRHGRMPVKAEKEPIRHLYENYNQLKSQIVLMEQEAVRQIQHQHSPAGAQQLNMRRVVAPPAASAPSSESDDSSRGDPGPIPRRGNKKLTKAPPTIAALPAPAASPSPQQDLAALKVEKGQLHQMLRSYEKDFFKQHKRQVSSFADIKPVASQYRRYKEIKKAISQLQSGGER